MVLARLLATARKEAKHILRDPRSLILALGIPLLLLWLFGYALTFDLNQAPTVVLDRDQTPASRDLLARLQASPYFSIIAYANSPAEMTAALNSGEALIGLNIPAGFGADLSRDDPAPIQLLLDGTDSTMAALAQSYIETVIKTYSLEQAQKRLKRLGLSEFEPPVEVRLRLWFNPEAKSKNFIIPGLIVVIIMIIAAQLTALTVAREFETGTLEWLIATPIRPVEVILGKLLPYLAIGFIDVIVAVLAGIYIFDVPFRGQFWLLALLSLLFIIGTLALGILISVMAKNQVVASQMSVVVTFLPAFILSDFVFPIYNMPLVLKLITYLVPARYMIAIAKGIFLKGVGFDVLVIETAFLAVFTLLAVLAAVGRFKKRLYL